jgi:hypothetical protein
MISIPESSATDESEEQLIAKARLALSDANWVIGECSGKWTMRYARGRTDADFGLLVGLSADQVYQRRRVWEVFGDRRGLFSGLSWSHFYAALTWDDAEDCLRWAENAEASVAEMKVWRRARRAAELPVDEALQEAIQLADAPLEVVGEPPASCGDNAPVSPARHPAHEPELTAASAARQAEGSAYYPYRADAGSPPPAAGAEEPARARPTLEERVEKITDAFERCRKAITDELAAEFGRLPAPVRERFLRAARQLQARIESLK